MGRSVSLRNLVGGFLGGFIGILSSWYLGPTALPFGVLLGVVTGWWVEDIVQMLIRSYHTTYCFWRRLVARIVPKGIRTPHRNFVEYSKVLLGVCAVKIGNGISCALRYVVILFHWMTVSACATVHVPMRALRWASHPSSTALLITISAIVLGAVVNAFVFGTLWPWPETKMIGGGMSGDPEQLVPFALLDIVGLTCVATLFLTMFGLMSTITENGENSSIRNFYTRWERYSKCSPVTYFARELFHFFRSEVTVAVFFALAIAYWLTLGGALIALVMVPVATFVTFMIGLYRIAQRSAHWWCLGVTLVVTTVSALVFYSSFSNGVVLWMVALCTGITSGCVTEGMRRLGIWWGNTTMGQHYLGVWYDEDKMLPFSIATPAWRTLGRVFNNAGQRVIGFAA